MQPVPRLIPLAGLLAAWAMPAAGQPILQPGLPMPPVNTPQPSYTIRDAVITRVHELPPPSGILHTYLVVEARAPGPIDYRIQWTFLGGDQFIPPVGSVCSFTFHYEAMRFLQTESRRSFPDYNQPLLVATGLACNTGSDPRMEQPDPPPPPPGSIDREAMRQVAALPAALLPALEELPLPPVAGAPAGLRFRLLGAQSPRDPGMCGRQACGGRRFWYLLVWREGRPGSVLFQSTMAPAWRDVRIDSVTDTDGRIAVRVSGEQEWPDRERPRVRRELHGEAALP